MIDLRVCVCILFALGPTLGCLNASSFSVSLFNGPSILNSPTPVLVVDSSGSARAGNGVLGIGGQAFAHGPNVPAASAPAIAGSHASMVVDDLMFKGPGATTETSFIIPFEGIFGFANDHLVGSNGSVLDSPTFLSLFLNAQVTCFNCGIAPILNGNLEVDMDSMNVTATVPHSSQNTNLIRIISVTSQPITGHMAGETFAGFSNLVFFGIVGQFESGPVTVPTFVNLSLALDLSASSTTIANGISNGAGLFDLSHTFGLPQGVPVFNLPPGFSVDAPSIGLFDNVIGEPATVPEPSALMTIPAALAAFALIRRQRKNPFST